MVKAELLNAHEIAQATGLAIFTVRKHEAVGLFPKHVKVNGTRLWHRQEVEDWIAVNPLAGDTPIQHPKYDPHFLVDAVDGVGIIEKKMVAASDNAAIANMLPDEYVDIRQMAKCFNCSARTVQRYVRHGQLPPPVRFGHRAMWVVKLVREWVEKRSRAVEAEAEKEAHRLRNYSYKAR